MPNTSASNLGKGEAQVASESALERRVRATTLSSRPQACFNRESQYDGRSVPAMMCVQCPGSALTFGDFRWNEDIRCAGSDLLDIIAEKVLLSIALPLPCPAPHLDGARVSGEPRIRVRLSIHDGIALELKLKLKPPKESRIAGGTFHICPYASHIHFLVGDMGGYLHRRLFLSLLANKPNARNRTLQLVGNCCSPNVHSKQRP